MDMLGICVSTYIRLWSRKIWNNALLNYWFLINGIQLYYHRVSHFFLLYTINYKCLKGFMASCGKMENNKAGILYNYLRTNGNQYFNFCITKYIFTNTNTYAIVCWRIYQKYNDVSRINTIKKKLIKCKVISMAQYHIQKYTKYAAKCDNVIMPPWELLCFHTA